MQTNCATLTIMFLALTAPISVLATEAQPDVGSLVRDNTEFALDLYGKLAAKDGNLVFSPYSISVALGMTYAGARGTTEKEMAAALHFSLSQSELHPAFEKLTRQMKDSERDGIRLSVANAIWPQKGAPLLNDYLSLVKQHYGVQITALDYCNARDSACETINSWVKDKTENRITGLLRPSDLSDRTRLVLVNAVYFKGKWALPFTADITQPMPFRISSDRTIQAPMMKRKMECRYADLPELDIVELPYADGSVSMIVLLPKTPDGIQSLERELSAGRLTEWQRALKRLEVFVLLPRFKATCKFGLNAPLASMGMADAFSDTRADFSGMDGQPHRLAISTVVHQAFVEVNEDGTEAAASTAVAMAATAVLAKPRVFCADHPFVFLIQEKRTNSILFVGRLCDPSASPIVP
jgi:serpin B